MKIDYKEIIIKSELYWHIGRDNDQWTRNPCICSQLIFFFFLTGVSRPGEKLVFIADSAETLNICVKQ